MTVQNLGQVSVGQCVPALAGIVAQAQAEITAQLAGIAQINASIAVTPPGLLVSLSAATALVLALEAQIALSAALGLPEVTIDLSVMLSVQLELQAKLEILLALLDAMATLGVAVYVSSGEAQTFGAELQAEVSKLAPAGNAVQAVTFLATEPSIFAALSKVLFTG